MFRKIGDEFRYVASGEAPTTVEALMRMLRLVYATPVIEIEELTDK